MTDTATPPRTPQPGLVDVGRRYGIVAVLVALVAVATILHPTFLSPANLGNILVQNAAIGLVAVAMTFVIIAGGFDISVGATYALGATLFAGLTIQTGSTLLAGSLTLLAGVAVGATNGLLVSRIGVNPIVATLGTSSAVLGLAYVYSDSSSFSVDSREHPAFQNLAHTTIAGLPVPVWIMLVGFVAGGVVLTRTAYGRNVQAVGGNGEAAWLSGLRVPSIMTSTYVMAGMAAALAGMADASQLGVGQANVGTNVALDAIAIVVVGGTSIRGGDGAIWRTAVGLLILAVLTNIFYSLNVAQNWQLVAKGLIVLVAVTVDARLRSRSR
ncbi:ABC transporter permease [Pseudonocardia xishanensis]|uniref:ABC transporter permease n=1 Tax=Pseudonocardia xishanensis TaxID=630995 RepID=A0ABP8S1L3_9PSEU